MVRDVKEIQFVRRRLNTNFSFLSQSFESAKPNYSDDELWIKISLRRSPKEDETIGWIQKTKIEKYYSEED